MLSRSRGLFACLTVAVVAGSGAFAAGVHAYSDVYRFNDPAIDGGGGGRWFTGSPADALTCDVCHAGSVATEIVVRGLPERYQPGFSYDVTIEWPEAALNVTALVEITDPLGRGAGVVAPPPQVLSMGENCQPVEDQVPAAVMIRAPEIALADGRELVGMQDCGGHVLHWTWTAPVVDVGPVIFAGGIVVPDQRKDAAGDRVASLYRWVGSSSQGSAEMQLAGGCSAVPRPLQRSGVGVFVVGGVFCLVWRRRERGSGGRGEG